MATIYKNQKSRDALMAMYDSKLAKLNIEYEERDISTFAGNTHVIITGKEDGEPLVVFHAINAGAPITLEAIKGLGNEYRIYVIDTVGQTTKSAETRLSLKDDSIGKWIEEVLDALSLNNINCVGVSYGAFLLQKLISYSPNRIKKVIFVVPAGFVNGPFWNSMKRLSFPLTRFMLSKKEKHLRLFMNAFYNTIDDYGLALQRNTLLGVKMDYRRPPLFTSQDGQHFTKPVYAMVADNDVFFPGDKALENCKLIFKNFKGHHTIKNAKHIPEPSVYNEIEQTIGKWLSSRE